MEVARLLGRGGSLRRTVVLAAPDFEEIGLIGSRELVRLLRTRHRVRGAIVFDPIGYMNPVPNTQQVPPGVGLLYPRQLERLARSRQRRGWGRGHPSPQIHGAGAGVGRMRRRRRSAGSEW